MRDRGAHASPRVLHQTASRGPSLARDTRHRRALPVRKEETMRTLRLLLAVVFTIAATVAIAAPVSAGTYTELHEPHREGF